MKFIKLKLLTAVLFVTLKISAAVPSPPQPASIPPPVGDQVPIDSNILLLFASGIVLGSFFYIKKNKKDII